MPSDIPLVGIGTDVHAFQDGRQLRVAGLLWPGETGLAGPQETGDAQLPPVLEGVHVGANADQRDIRRHRRPYAGRALPQQ